MNDNTVKAVLGPTNTGKTHLAIERLCAHSSGAIGFPLRLLAREVYDRVCAIKGENRVALITGEERIEPKDARWLLCTVEAMPVLSGRQSRPAEGPMNADLAFVGIDEAQLAADRERGHIFTDRLLHARGREETMILGSATIEPLVRKLVPGAEIVSRPRFSTLRHGGAVKLSRVPPRSAIVAFSAEQVYAIAEMLRRFRGGAAVVMGALSPQTRNAQVAMYQSGEVDYLVATDAIGMGLNLDIDHVAFAGLSKFDGQRQRRLTTSEMAQIAGRAGRHQRDGTFGTLSGTRHHDAAFADEEIWAIENHRFPPLTKLFWRDAEPRFDSVGTLISDLEQPPQRPELAHAPEGIDLAVLKRLAEDDALAGSVRGAAAVKRFWDVCSLPDFRQHGAETHARFVARLWEDLRGGYLGADYVAARIADLDNPSGDIDTLQGRIAAVRSWAYIAQRPDWVLAREEMAARARGVEARLSDALHARLTERFVNRRTAVLMKKLGPDAGLLPVTLDVERVLVDGEAIGTLEGFRFRVDPRARAEDHRLLLAAAERHLPEMLARRAEDLTAALAARRDTAHWKGRELHWQGGALARIERGRSAIDLVLRPLPLLDTIPEPSHSRLFAALQVWLEQTLAPLEPLRRIDRASRDPGAGPELRALLIRLLEAGGILERTGSGLEALSKQQRGYLARIGVKVGALDIFLPGMVRRDALAAWQLPRGLGDQTAAELPAELSPVIPAGKPVPGYRRVGDQAVRVDIAERLLREAHGLREAAGRRAFVVPTAMAVSMGLTVPGHARLLRLAGFNPSVPALLPEGAYGPPRPVLWTWRPPRTKPAAPRAEGGSGAFAELAKLLR